MIVRTGENEEIYFATRNSSKTDPQIRKRANSQRNRQQKELLYQQVFTRKCTRRSRDVIVNNINITRAIRLMNVWTDNDNKMTAGLSSLQRNR